MRFIFITQKNMALRTIHKRLQEEIPELTFKMFHEAYTNMYSHKNPLTFTEKEFNTLFHKVKKYIDIKKLERERRLRELQQEVKEEVKEEPINTDMYNALLLRDRSLTINEFNRIYRLIVDLFNDEMTFNDRINLMYNHIGEIRRNI
jgi:hypothetical protein